MPPRSPRKRKSAKNGSNEGRRVKICAPTSSNRYPQPFLCSFPGGIPSALQPGEESADDSIKFQMKSNSKGKVIVGKDGSCSYTCLQAKDSGKRKESTRLCVGIYDKKNKTLTLHEVGGNGQVVPLSQSINSYNLVEKEKNVTAAEQRQALFEEFGSAGKRRQIRSQEANRVNVETVVGSGSLVVNSVLQGESMSESNKQAIRDVRDNGDTDTPAGRRSKAIEDATDKWRRDFLPSFNLKASEPHEIYSAKEIVGGRFLWDFFHNHVTKCLERENPASALIDGLDWEESQRQNSSSDGKNEGEEQKEKRSFRGDWQPSLVAVVRRILGIKSTQEKLRRLVCAQALSYMSSLYMKLHNRRSIPPAAGGARYMGAPSGFGRYWLNTFTVESIDPDGQTSQAMSKHYKDKCVTYMFLLLLMAEGGKEMSSPDLRPFTDDLRMDIKETSHLLREAGCVVKNGSTTSAKLLAPLKFPPPKRGARKAQSSY